MSVSLKFSTASVSTTNQLNGRPSDDVVQVDTPRMLERLASPVDPANLHESKKVKSDNPSGDSGVDVCDMEADVVPEPASLRTVPLVNEGIDAKFDGVKNKASVEVHESIGVSQRKGNASYAQVIETGSNIDGWFADEQSLNTEDVIVLDEDCVITEEGDYPTIKFFKRVNDQDHDNWKDFLMSAWDSESDLPSALNDMKPKMGPLLNRVVGNRTPNHPNALVVDMIDEHGQWRWDLFDHLLPCDLLLRIATVKPLLGVSYDYPSWLVGANQEFSIRSIVVVCQGKLYGPLEPICSAIADFTSLPQVNSEYCDTIYSHSLRMAETGLHGPAQTRAIAATLSLDGRTESWCKPLPGWCKLNIDGAVRRGSYITTCGAWSLKIQHLMVETDCLEAYRLIMEPDATHDGSTLLPYILELIFHTWEVKLQHVRRCSDALDDRMAKMASNSDLIARRFLDPPSNCQDILVEEAMKETVSGLS
ncbi:hypothetical protein V6N12_010544 [Hibiscus sabdariffa]|uniref:RNase H type-1 domain-containing protein n=1 Tax=Hibiscus sabdariffa TaxID=183260 RepID=A0ABR2EKE9_9ROSI